jgi:PmbA protein
MNKTANIAEDMPSIAQSCIELSTKKGANAVSADVYRVRKVEFQWRDGKPETVTEATTRGVQLDLYVDGRYARVSTSDLRPEALESLIGDTVVVARSLAQDPYRGLPDPELYEGQAELDLGLEDPRYDELTADHRRQFAQVAEAGAREVKGSDAILSVTTSFSDTLTERFLVNSNGFSGASRGTVFSLSAEVGVKDKDGRRPEDYSYATSRGLARLPKAALIGKDAGERSVARLGAGKGESAMLPMVVDNRAGGRMVGLLMSPLSGSSLQQKRSFLEGKLGEAVFGDKITIVDDPLIAGGLGSRLWDSEGIAARRRPIVEAGVLKSYYIDTYYGRKLKVAPTSGDASNLSWNTGSRDPAALIAGIDDGIFVTGFLGGNSNGLTGDFSLGVLGFRIRDGQLAEPVGEMNISGNHLEFWKRLVAVGNDPFPYSPLRTPTLVFDGVSFAGV